jgi:preprotein translocase subunit SecF
MRGYRFIPDDTKLPFMRWSRFGFFLSGILCALSIFVFATFDLNYGVDFKGGTLIQIQTKGPADIGKLREDIGGLGLGEAELQEFGKNDTVLIRLKQQPGGDAAQQAAVAKVKDTLGTGVEFQRVEVVGPKVSGELAQQGTIAVVLSILAVVAYIWFRFEWQFSVGAIASLLHDVILTIGLLTILRVEFNLSIIAAILTIVGYSLNDTVVVFDRIREFLRKYKTMPLVELIEYSLNSTLARTILTSITTMVALTALYIFGGEVIRGFTFTMLWGVIIGTYSSIFVAAPVLIILGTTREWSGEAKKADGEKVLADS